MRKIATGIVIHGKCDGNGRDSSFKPTETNCVSVENTKGLIEARVSEFCSFTGHLKISVHAMVGTGVYVQHSMSASQEPAGPVNNKASQDSALLTKRQLS